jgi:RNA polymerase sigma-70 factor, ECF subfamily
LLRAGLLRMTETAVPWHDVAAKLRPFVATRVAGADIDDVLQDVLLRMHRGIGTLADEDRLASWMFAIARNAITDHGRARARHPIAEPADAEAPPRDDDRDAARALSGCVAMFVAMLPSPYREAVTLVELESLTIREAAAMAGISVSGMKSRVQRGREQLRDLLVECCHVELDRRGGVIDYRTRDGVCHACTAAGGSASRDPRSAKPSQGVMQRQDA